MSSSSSTSTSGFGFGSVIALCAILVISWPSPSEADVLCEGLPSGGRLYCHIACCIRQEGSRQSYYCCGSDDGSLPPKIYREGGQKPMVYREDRVPDRYNSVSYSSVRIDWWNTLLISLAVSIILSLILSLLCCLFCARRRR